MPGPRGAGPDLERDRAREPGARAGGDHQGVPADRAAPHRGGRGADPDHEAEAHLRQREVQGSDRRHVRKEPRMKKRLAVSVLAAVVAFAGVATAQKETRGVTKTAIVGGLGTPMNNALFKDQFDAGVLNLFPLSAARSMYDPFHKLKFYGAASYVDQVKAGINYFVTNKGKKALCAMYQDTDFGKEVLDGVQAQAEKMKLKIVETVTHKPTDQDFSAQVTKLKAANCDLVVLGTIVRDSIVPYATARKMGWTDVDFLGSAASYDLFVAAAQGGVTEGFYAMGLTAMPYRDTLGAPAQAWFDRYKERYKVDPNIGAIYGHVAADLTVLGLEKTGPELTTDNFVKGLESIKGYRDIFNGPEANFGPDKHQGANSSFLAVVKGGRWVRLTDPLTF